MAFTQTITLDRVVQNTAVTQTITLDRAVAVVVNQTFTLDRQVNSGVFTTTLTLDRAVYRAPAGEVVMNLDRGVREPLGSRPFGRRNRY